MIVTEHLDVEASVEFTPEELKQLATLDLRQVVYDYDAPKLTRAEFEKFRELRRKTA